MTVDRSERNRELIEKSATLLAADYAFDVLVARVCEAIAATMGGTAFVALRNDDETVRIYSVAPSGERSDVSDQLLPEDSRIAQVLNSGRSFMDNGEKSEAGMRSAIYVPIAYGEDTHGVLSVQHASENEFSRDDLRVVESIARHLAIAMRNERGLKNSYVRSRYPIVLGIAIAAFVLLATVFALSWTNGRIAAARAAAVESELQDGRRAAAVVQRTIDQDAEFATVAASVVGPVRSNDALATALLGRLLEARGRESVDRLGIFYDRSVAERRDSFGFFVSMRANALHLRMVSGYPHEPWYRAALSARGANVYQEPSEDGGERYLGVARSFRAGTSAPGVVSAQTLVRTLLARIVAVLPPGAAVVVRDGTGGVLLSTGAAPADPSATLNLPLSGIPWKLQFTGSAARVNAQTNRAAIAGALLIGLVWIAGAFLICIVYVVQASRRAADGLKRQRAELQSEIASRLDVEERLRTAAYHDALTGLPNRAFFLNQLGDVLEQRRLNTGVEYAVLFIDLDRFYVVNDSLGHGVGDQLLAAIAYRLEETIPPHALIARLGGDEFVLLLPSQGPAIAEAVAIAEDILEALRNPFALGEREVYSGASIGIVTIDASYADSETILRDADISMYHAKRSGRARYAVFDHAMRERITEQLELEGSLRGAVDRGEIVAFYQPIVSVADESIVGFEALARWHRDGATHAVSASEFVPLAELTGMMRAIDAELFAQVCRDVAGLHAVAPGVRVSVNVSANDLTRASLLADIDSTLDRFSVPATAVRIEITETAVMEDAERALAMLGELRRRGLEIVVDDFGAGYSSLSYLQRLPLAGVKIDRSFITPLPGNGQALEIVRAIVALAKTLGLHVTAEGVEREEQFNLLRMLGVDYAQGYWFSPAVSFEDAKSLFAVRS